MSNMKHLTLTLTAILAALVAIPSTAATITYCDLGCGTYGPNGFTLTPASAFAPYTALTATPLDNLNANYATPQTFELPANTTLISFNITPLDFSVGAPFSLWLNEITISNRIFGSNLNDPQTFFGVFSDTPIQRLIVTTANDGYPFRIDQFRVGPTEAADTDTPEPGTLAMLGSGLIAIGAATRRRFNFFQLKRLRGPKREHAEAMRRVLDAMDGRERLVLLRYYCDNKTVEEIAAEFGCSAEWIRAVKAEARSRFGAAIKTPCQGRLGDLIVSA